MNGDNKELAQIVDKETVKKSVRVRGYVGKLYVDPLVAKVEVKKFW